MKTIGWISAIYRSAKGQRRRHSLPVLPFFIVLPVILPVAAVASGLINPTPEIWRHLWQTLLPEMLLNTALLLLGVGAGTFILGAGLAWLVTAYRFPGQPVFEWLHLLPLAIPTYVMGFVYMSVFDFAGPVQSLLRHWLGSADWFPEIRSGGGAVLAMTLALYPYVYMLAKAGYRGLSASAFETARIMGCRSTDFFFRIALPLARPAIAGGLALALMEALADFATVRFFNFPTLSEGVIRVWHGMMDLGAASELAGLLAVFALAVILSEKALRGRSRYYQPGGKAPGMPVIRLVGWRKWAATALCTLVTAAAFGLPMLQLIWWAAGEISIMSMGTALVYSGLILNSLMLSGLAALFAVMAALILASSVRLSGGKATALFARVATTGYAVPGAVIAVGILLTTASLDHAANRLWAGLTGAAPGLILTGSLAGLVYGYVARFLAVAYNSVDAGLEKIKPDLTLAAKVLRAGPWRILWSIHLPLLAPSVLAGSALVFVDVMKELPITVMLRPFGYDTLAVWVWQMAAESVWTGAALPAIIIVLSGLIPVIFLTHVSIRK